MEILERQRQNAEGDAQAELALLERRGTLLYERMAASEAAIDVFKRIQALDPKNARAARALREIYAQAGDYTALEALYAEQGAFGELCDQLTSLHVSHAGPWRSGYAAPLDRHHPARLTDPRVRHRECDHVAE